MNGNLLTRIPKGTFNNLASLQILDLSRNKIENVEAGSFDSNTQLRAVRLDSNRLTGIEGLFSRVPDLMWLNVSENKIQAFDYSLVPLTLTWLDISHNKVRSLDSFTALHSSLISYLDASFNELVKLESNSFPAAVETLLLNDNKISQVAPYAFFHLTKLVKADLSVNEISSLTENSLRLSTDTVAVPLLQPGRQPHRLQLPHAVVPEHQQRGQACQLPAHHRPGVHLLPVDEHGHQDVHPPRGSEA